MDYLAQILDRKRAEVRRRLAHAGALAPFLERLEVDPERGRRAVAALRRGGASLPRVIAEVKFRSPSAGSIRRRSPGEGERIAAGYARAGAAVVSVHADGPGFGGSLLEVRRIAAALEAPVLFKGFVLDPIQVRFARAAGASLVLLIVRALEGDTLRSLVACVRDEGMEPVVEAADAAELERAVATGATIVGVNARDLRTFRVDMETARRALEAVPSDRVAVFMSGVRSKADLERLAGARADAVLVGEGLMRATDPEAELRRWLGGA